MDEKNLKFTNTHEWVYIDGSSATIGITEHAQKELGDVVFVELPEAGSEIRQFEEFGTIESTKAASQLYAPLSGKVTEVNTLLNENPALVNNEPYAGGWMIKIEILSPEETSKLMNFEEYSKSIK